MEKSIKIELLENGDTCELAFGNFPFWQGLQDRPGIGKTLPFKLVWKAGEHIQLDASAFEINDVTDVYQSSDYNFITTPPGQSDWSNQLGDISVDWVKKLLPPNCSPANILEIGAGSLYVAKKIKEFYKPASYTIVDPSIRESSREFDIIKDYFPADILGDKRFDLILAFNTLEHLPDPRMFLNSLRKYLTPGGLVILTFPDCERQLKLGDLNVLLHEHLNYFTKASVRAFFSAMSFDVEQLHTFDDTFVVLAKPAAEMNAGVETDLSLVDKNVLREAHRSFEQGILSMKSLVKTELGKGNSIGFHGATNGLNTLLFLLSLEREARIKIYDGDQNKTGKYLPAFHAPILYSGDASYAENKVIIVSAITYFDSICRFAQEKHGLAKDRIFKLA